MSAVQMMPGKRSLVDALAPVQAMQAPGAASSSENIQQHAQAGVAGSGSTLPHIDRIQASFGHHDVGGISAHVGGAATAATSAIGATAYATGSSVAFGSAPDLHTAAHEAAHVVQQRGGVQLKGGVGAVGDPYEHHADAVADRVVRGESAVDLLDAGAGGGGGGTGVQRKWNAAVELQIAALPKTIDPAQAAYAALHDMLSQYDKVSDAALAAKDLALLGEITTKIVEIIETQGVDNSAKQPLRDLSGLVRLEEDRARYVMQHAATQGAFKTGVPRYLNVTPTPGTKEALSTGSEGKYDASIPVEEQFRVGVPKSDKEDLDITVDGGGGVIDLLVVSGGHGGVGAMFEMETGGHFSEKWWSDQVNILAGKNVSAKLIVLDACLTASIAKSFAPLLAPHGKIVGYVHSIPQMVMTDQIWKEVHNLGGKTVEQVIDARIAKVNQEHAASRHGTVLGATVAVALYDADRQYLRYDDQALSDATLKQLTDGKEQSELGAMKYELTKQGAKPVTGYAPGIAHEGGVEVVQATTKTVARADLADWFDAYVMPITPSGFTADKADELTDSTGQEWIVVDDFDAQAASIKLEKKPPS